MLVLGIGLPHPLHSSSAALTDLGDGRFSLSVRIFTDDLNAVAPGGDSAVAAYARRRVLLLVPNGQIVPLEITAIVVDGDLTQITARGRVAAGLSGVRVQLAVLWERYRDQVNLLRATIGNQSTTMVFANGDPPRGV